MSVNLWKGTAVQEKSSDEPVLKEAYTVGELPIESTTHRHWAYLLLAIPPFCFYLILFRLLSGFPFLDDYDAVLNFLLKWRDTWGLARLTAILHFQHNEYRLIFADSIVALQYLAIGHVMLKPLAVFGDLLVLLIFVSLYLLWRTGEIKRFGILTLVPVSCLLFQLQYAETLNWPAGSLQNVSVIAFALLALIFATSDRSSGFSIAVVCLILAVCSSGNGLFLIPVGAIVLLQLRQAERLAVWLLTGLIVSLVYFHNYNFNASRTHANHSVLSSLTHLSLKHALAFLGSIGAAKNALPAICLGFVLLLVFGVATSRKLYARHPALYYAMAFFVVTALAVSGLRSDAGPAEALASRYRINSTMMVILAYLYLAPRIIQSTQRSGRFVPALYVATAALFVFTVASDAVGYKILNTRREMLDAAMMRWELGEPPLSQDATATLAQRTKEKFFEPVEPTLSDSIKAGIFLAPRPREK